MHGTIASTTETLNGRRGGSDNFLQIVTLRIRSRKLGREKREHGEIVKTAVPKRDVELAALIYET
jgi:hypothetical protein